MTESKLLPYLDRIAQLGGPVTVSETPEGRKYTIFEVEGGARVPKGWMLAGYKEKVDRIWMRYVCYWLCVDAYRRKGEWIKANTHTRTIENWLALFETAVKA